MEQKYSTPEKTVEILVGLIEDENARSKIQSALAKWHAPNAAEQIAEIILKAIVRSETTMQSKVKKCGCGHSHGAAKHAH